MSLLRSPGASALGWEAATKQKEQSNADDNSDNFQASSNTSNQVSAADLHMPSRAKTLPSASSTDTADNDDEKNAPFAVFEEPDGSLTVSYSKSFQADDSRRDGIGECSQNLSEIVITGTATVTVLEGSVEILGCCLNDSDDVPSVDIYSPDGSWSSALTIVDTSYSRGKQIGTFFPTRLRISSLSFHNPVSSQWRRRTFALKTRSQVRCALSLPDRWKMAADAVLSDLVTKDMENAERVSASGPDMARTLVCGAKGVGKSTYVRYLVNRIMTSRVVASSEGGRNPTRRVAVVDCDVGQAELGPPGLLTLTVLDKPLLSPPHAHMVSPGGDVASNESSLNFVAAPDHISARFFGHFSSKADPVSYTAAIAHLVQQYEAWVGANKDTKCVEKLPLIVNTDGWIKGMGFEILSSIVDIVRPGHIVQLLGSTRSKFFDLTPHAREGRSIHVTEALGKVSQHISPLPSRSPSPVPHSANRPSTASDTEALGTINSSTLRSLRLTTYFLGGFSNLLSTGANFWPSSGGIYDLHCKVASALSSMRPYVVPFHSVFCSTPNIEEFGESGSAEDLALHSLNGSIVGLCRWEGESVKMCHQKAADVTSVHVTPPWLNATMLPCVGLGIVRGIDVSRKCFYILTPVSEGLLARFVPNLLVRASFQLPQECTFLGVHSESFPHQSCEVLSAGIGDDIMKSKNAPGKK